MESKFRYETMDEEEGEEGGWFGYIKVVQIFRTIGDGAFANNRLQQAALRPFDILFSKTARRAYLTTLLLIFGTTVLLGLAVIAYTLFYWSYIPRIGFERTIYLQFDNVFSASDSRYDGAGNPYGTIGLSPDIVSLQRYDVQVELTLPRTPDNRNAGNFMLEAAMFAPGTMIDPVKDTILPGAADVDNRLAFSRRPAILSYRSWIMEYIYRLTELHWYLLGLRQETEKLKISMWENVEFPRGWRNLPATMRLDIQSSDRMQVYSAEAIFKARFRGLRWLMYNHRIISAFVFITGFWTTEMIFAGLAWAALSIYLQPHPQENMSEDSSGNAVPIKQESQEGKMNLSDTERTFPTSSRQQPLRYESPNIKQEEYEDAVLLPESSTRATEADDEEDDPEMYRDSGLGTSLESGTNRRDSMRRRKGRTTPDDELR